MSFFEGFCASNKDLTKLTKPWSLRKWSEPLLANVALPFASGEDSLARYMEEEDNFPTMNSVVASLHLIFF